MTIADTPLFDGAALLWAEALLQQPAEPGRAQQGALHEARGYQGIGQADP